MSPWPGRLYSGLVPFSMSHSSLMTAHGEQWLNLGNIKTLIISELCKREHQCQHLTPILSSSLSLSLFLSHQCTLGTNYYRWRIDQTSQLVIIPDQLKAKKICSGNVLTVTEAAFSFFFFFFRTERLIKC